MRTIFAVLIIIYLIGVGVVLAPTISGKWNNGTPAELSASVLEVLPLAFSWPVTAYHHLIDDEPSATPTPEPTPTKE
jgi:hypothetical protein